MNGMSVVESVVRQINGGVFCKIDYSIPAKAYIRKGATDGTARVNPFWQSADAIRCERTNVQINLGVIYPKAVNGRLIRMEIEPSFEAVEMKGKINHEQHHKNLCQSTDRTKTYLRYMPMQNTDRTTKFTLDGADITDALRPFMAPQSKESKKQSEAGLAIVDQIEWRTLNLDHITRMDILGAEITQ